MCVFFALIITHLNADQHWPYVTSVYVKCNAQSSTANDIRFRWKMIHSIINVWSLFGSFKHALKKKVFIQFHELSVNLTYFRCIYVTHHCHCNVSSYNVSGVPFSIVNFLSIQTHSIRDPIFIENLVFWSKRNEMNTELQHINRFLIV